MTPSVVVFLHSHRYDRLYQAVSLLLTASSMGWPCHLFLFYQALASYMAHSWDEVNITSPGEDPVPKWLYEMEKGFELGNFPSLYEMLEKAGRESGGVRTYACSTSCKVLGLDPGTVREKVDEIVGLHTMLRISADATHVLYV